MPEMVMGETIERDGPRGGDFAGDIAGLQTQFDLLRYMRRISQAFGFKSFMICHLPSFDGEKLAANSLLSNMPAELVSKVPTADLETLRPQLPDESAFGVSYAEIDAFLEGRPVSESTVSIIERLYLASRHKRGLPVQPE